jgi:NitT/TauT family transport system ATP-binding protein
MSAQAIARRCCDFKDDLEDRLSEAQAEETLRAIISWARFAEVFAYDEQEQGFSLDIRS